MFLVDCIHTAAWYQYWYWYCIVLVLVPQYVCTSYSTGTVVCTGTGTIACTGTGTVVCAGTGTDVCTGIVLYTDAGTVMCILLVVIAYHWVLFNTMCVWNERNNYFLCYCRTLSIAGFQILCKAYSLNLELVMNAEFPQCSAVAYTREHLSTLYVVLP